jgi:hypothetical protein
MDVSNELAFLESLASESKLTAPAADPTQQEQDQQCHDMAQAQAHDSSKPVMAMDATAELAFLDELAGAAGAAGSAPSESAAGTPAPGVCHIPTSFAHQCCASELQGAAVCTVLDSPCHMAHVPTVHLS